MTQLSTPQDRLHGSVGYQVWETTLAEQCGAFHPEPPKSLGIESFEGAIRPASMAVAGYAGAKIETNCPHIHRDVKDIKRDGHDFYYIVQQIAGVAVMEHCSTQSILNPGDLLLLDSSKPSDFYFPGMSEQVSILIPRHKLDGSIKISDLGLNNKVDSGSKAALVAKTIIEQFFTTPSDATENEILLDTLISLMRSSLSNSNNSTASYSEKIQRSYFEKAQRCIEAKLSDFELTPEVIAGELGTSKRTLHRIFAQNGQSIGRYILDRRLDRCASEFEDVTDIQKISAVAFAWGFNDVSHFSRVFKARFGVSPRSYKNKNMAVSDKATC